MGNAALAIKDSPRELDVREQHSSVVVPDIVLPEQFFSKPRTDSDTSPEKALMLAVLEDAVRCFQLFLASRRRHLRLSLFAEEWIATRDWDWPFSFNNCCDSLGIDSDALRKTLLQMKNEYLQREPASPPVSRRGAVKLFRLNSRAKGGKR